MSTPFKDETVTDWLLQELVDEAGPWMLRATGDEDAMKHALKMRRREFPERVYRLVKRVVHETREIAVPANEPSAPKKEKKSEPADDRGTAAPDAEAEDVEADGEVRGGGVQVR